MRGRLLLRRPLARGIAASVIAAALVTSCGGEERDGWRDADGPTEEVREIKGDDDHCDFGSITYIQLDDQREAAYVRDPEGLVSEYEGFEGRTQDLDADLPDDALRTPLRRGDGTELWRSADGDYIFLVRDDVVERLPLSDPGPWCA